MTLASLAVVVPALDEAARIETCLRSVVQQAPGMQVRVSDNCSTDQTAALARAFGETSDVIVRTVDRLPASDHFVSAGRWALATTTAPALALLAGDDEWEDGFVTSALSVLAAHPDIDVVFPAFRWHGGRTPRLLAPSSFTSGPPWWRQLQALVQGDHRELANLVYGVYRREAFSYLLDTWERGGERFGSDFAAAWVVLRRHRVLACPAAVGRRHERADVDLLARVGIDLSDVRGPIALASAYVRLNVRVNSRIAVALRQAAIEGWRPSGWLVHLLRAPQWIWAVGRRIAAVACIAR